MWLNWQPNLQKPLYFFQRHEKWRSPCANPFPVIVFWTHYMGQTSKGQERMQHPCQTPTQRFSHYLNQLWCSLTCHARCFGYCVLHTWGLLPAACFFSLQWIRWAEKSEWQWQSLPERTGQDAAQRANRVKGDSAYLYASEKLKSISTYLPEKEETKSNLNGSQPDGVEIHHKVHELLRVCWDQIDNLPHGASPPGSAVYHQRLHWHKERHGWKHVFNFKSRWIWQIQVRNVLLLIRSKSEFLIPFCKPGPSQLSLPSCRRWSKCTCTDDWKETGGRKAGTSEWHRSSPSTVERRDPSWNPEEGCGGWRKDVSVSARLVCHQYPSKLRIFSKETCSFFV